MKVCILTTSFPLREGDPAGLFIFEQIRCLAAFGVEAEVIAPHHPGVPKREIMNGVPVRRAPYVIPERLQSLCYGDGIPDNLRKSTWNKLQLPFLLLMFLVQALKHARTSDLIHAHWSIAGLSGLIASRILGKPFVLTMHHGSTRAVSGIEKLVVEGADQVIFNSSFTRSQTMKGAAPRASAVIPPSVDMLKLRPMPYEETREYRPAGIPDHAVILFSLGRFIELKGHAFLIEALRLLPPDRSFHLLIGGDGPLHGELEKLVRQKGLEGRVTFLGHIPTGLTPYYHSLADIYLQPSIVDRDGNTEGLGMTLIEALACGTPCIGSRVGGIPDVVVDGENGFLVEPGSPEGLARKILVLMEDEDLRARMGKNGRRFVEERYSWEAKAREHAHLYAGLIRSRQGHTPHEKL
jgi:glycosyltransferase involved in cell wall biosynthesis